MHAPDAVPVKLQLAWPNKDKFLLVPKDDAGKPVWVEADHPAAHEVRLADFTGAYGVVNDAKPHADNLLFTGDSLDVLRILAESPEYQREYRGKVKLVYIDPPFNTGQTFEHYDDWMEHSTWLSFMKDRLQLIWHLLEPSGTVWIHLDNAEVHRMRVLLDETFGSACFLNEVVWRRTQGKSAAKRGMGTMTDTILVYGRTEGAALKPVLMPLTDKHLAAKYRFSDDRGRYMLDNLSAPGKRSGDSGEPWGGRTPPGRDRHWAAPTVEGVNDGEHAALPTRARLQLLDAAGYVHWPSGETSVPMFKRYLHAGSGTAVGDLWDDIGRVANTAAERVGYDTQKPEALLQRVITMSTRPGDVVLDVFAGSGTTAATAHKMGRRWVTADISSNTTENYVLPRLQRVVDGADHAGISIQIVEAAASESLPDGTSADQFDNALRAMKSLAGVGQLPDDPSIAAVMRTLRALSRKTKETQVLWAGGGGFRAVKVAPAMYEVTPFGVMLADWATNGRFARSVAGQLGFEWQPDAAPFCGVRGRMRLAVLDGAFGPEDARLIAAALADKERVTVVAKAVLDGAETVLAEASPGSRVRKAPRDLLTSGARRARRRIEGGVA